jgi:hypothetical protein
VGAAHEERELKGAGGCGGISQAAVRGRRRTTSGRRRVLHSSRRDGVGKPGNVLVP